MKPRRVIFLNPLVQFDNDLKRDKIVKANLSPPFSSFGTFGFKTNRAPEAFVEQYETGKLKNLLTEYLKNANHGSWRTVFARAVSNNCCF